MKNKKEMFNYLLFGGLTTLVNIVTYYIFTDTLNFDYKLSTTIAWVVSVIFAYITNKIYVFNSKQHNFIQVAKEFFSFIFFRVLSYFIDILSMFLLIEFLLIDDLISKIAANVIVVIFNYFVSKLVIFRSDNGKQDKASQI